MAIISDILLIAGALGAAFYCFVLSKRLRRFTDLEQGVGGAVAVLSAQVDDMTKTLQSAQAATERTSGELGELTARAEEAARRLELLVASLHDLPEAKSEPQPHADDAEPPVSGAETPVSNPSTVFLSKRSRIQEAAE